MSTQSQQCWLDAWYGRRRWTLWLLPLMWLFRGLSFLRRWWLTRFCRSRLEVPVIVVGNITLGGTGKTPLLIALARYLGARGFRPGVISRGYGGHAPHYPYLLTPHSTAAEVGDEPLSIFEATGCPVCVGADRVASAQLLIAQGCDLLLSDDGLQHYRLERDIEIAVVDGQRGFGNGFCLPVGPLREPLSRLSEVDLIVVNGEPSATFEFSYPSYPYQMDLVADHWVRLVDNQQLPLARFATGTRVNAIAGIGNPHRFYHSLRKLGLVPVEHDFPDHHAYDAEDFHFDELLPVVMTVKDAVKCRAFLDQVQPSADWYALVVNAELPQVFWERLNLCLDRWCAKPGNTGEVS